MTPSIKKSYAQWTSLLNAQGASETTMEHICNDMDALEAEIMAQPPKDMTDWIVKVLVSTGNGIAPPSPELTKDLEKLVG